LRFETYVADAANSARPLQADTRFEGLFIIGHSESSLIGMMAARKLDVAGFISVAGTGDRDGNLLREQPKKNLSAPLIDQSWQIIDQLEHGKEVAHVSSELTVIFRPSVQPYLISWLKLDRAAELRQLKCPALVVSGATDIQISPRHAKLLAGAPRQSFASKDRWNESRIENCARRQNAATRFQFTGKPAGL
jgi:pimeloyl-ACP methyl ester carboxylesterase